MKSFMKKNSLQLLVLGLTACFGMGCMLSDAKDASVRDPFPKPLGEKIIPLEGREQHSSFKYVELDTDGKVLIQEKALSLSITLRGANLYGYAFENPKKGSLLLWKDGGANRDSAGVYLAGHFDDSMNYLDSTQVLWIPQLPHKGKVWKIDSLRVMELVTADTALFTEVLFPYGADLVKNPIQNGLQKQSTLLFKETAGDTLTFYHFSRGIGCLAFERSVKGRLLAAGIATNNNQGYYRAE